MGDCSKPHECKSKMKTKRSLQTEENKMKRGRERKRRCEVSDNGSQRKRLKRRWETEEGKKRCKSEDNNHSGGSKHHGHPEPPPRPLPLSISSYIFHSQLGKGSFGKVMLASISSSQKCVAVKVIKKDLNGLNANSLKRERRILTVANGSPFLSHMHAAFQSKHHVYFVLEYLEGGSLRSHVPAKESLETPRVMFYAAEITCGLQYLHSKRIIHRDLKLENIVLDREGHIRIIDFGLAKGGLRGTRTATGIRGTSMYMAPEMCLYKPYAFAVDWWSLGVILFRLVTGKFPFLISRSFFVVVRSIVNDHPRYPENIDRNTKDILVKLLQKNPKHRLGASGDIRQHPFFNDINWEELENYRPRRPFQPTVDMIPVELVTSASEP